MAEPLDLTARLSVEHDLDVNLFVEAGAGTGKTTTLVKRVVRLFATGRLDEPRQLAAITFTEAAASELRDRIRSSLEAAGSPDGGLEDPTERARCAAAAARIDEAAITTLHGFAQRILAERPIAAGLPPAFEVEEGIAAELEALERWSAFVGDLLAEPELEPLLKLATTLGLRFDRLHEIAQRMKERWHQVQAPPGPVPVPDLHVHLDGVVGELRAAVALLDGRDDTHPDDGLVVLLIDVRDAVLPRFDAAIASGDQLEMARCLDELSWKRTAGRQEVWGKAPKAEVVDHLAAAADLQDQHLAELRTAIMEALLPRVAAFTLEWADERRRLGRLHFHDLLVHAQRLLWGSPQVRRELAERWRVLLVDEFQDTDPLQVELVFALAAAEPDVLPAAWDDIELGAGRVLVVGDPKQSIYGFRGADITLWNRTRRRFGDAVVTLSQNFRSVDPILGWVNDLFEQVMQEGDLQPAYTALHPQRVSLDDHPAMVAIGGPSDQYAAEIRAAETAEVAEVVAALRADRGIAYQDVAVLVPTRTPVGQLERALDAADIPYRIESRSLVWATDAVRDLLSILTAVEDPADEVAVVAALRTPAFACSDIDLVEWRAAGGRWDHTRRFPEALGEHHPVARAMGTLLHWHRERHWCTVDALLDQVVRERGLVELTFSQRRPRDHWRRIRFLVDQARAFVEAGGATLAEFLRWADLQVEGSATAVESVVPDPDDDAVRILTVHGAKGLEFPVVVLAGLGGGQASSFNDLRWTDDGRGHEALVTAYGGAIGGRKRRFATAGWGDAAGAADAAERAEALRVLYVATTRARDLLVVSLHHKARADCHANRIHASGVHPALWAHGGAAAEQLPLLVEPSPVPPARTEAQRAEWVAAWRDDLRRSAAPWVVSPSGLAGMAALDRQLDELEQLDDPPFADEHDDTAVPEPSEPGAEADPVAPAHRRGGTAVGLAVHAVLETVPLAGTGPVDPATVEALAVRFAAEHQVDDAELVRDLATSALASEALAEARQAGRLWREVPVFVPVGGHLVEGFIDLLHERADGSLVVVDWKTDKARTPSEVDASVGRYRAQGAAYAVALAAATGRAVTEVRFVFCRPAGEPAVERTITDLAAAVAEVEAALASAH